MRLLNIAKYLVKSQELLRAKTVRGFFLFNNLTHAEIVRQFY